MEVMTSDVLKLYKCKYCNKNKTHCERCILEAKKSEKSEKENTLYEEPRTK